MPILGGLFIPNNLAKMTPKEEFDNLFEMHKQGLPVDIEKAVKDYTDAMKAANPLQIHPGSMPDVYGQPAAHNHALIPAKHKWHDHTLRPGMPDVVKAAMERAFMPDKDELRRVLATRLRVRQGDLFPLEFIDFHVGKDKVYVFCVTPTGATIIEDGLDLFPSDALITAINLLKG